MSSHLEKVSSMLSDDFSTTHWASPSRKNHKETPPNILAEEVVFSVDESIEFRVFGRHGWHVGKIVKREMVGDGTAMRYCLSVQRLIISHLCPLYICIKYTLHGYITFLLNLSLSL